MTCQAGLAPLVHIDAGDVINMLRDPTQLQAAFQPQVNLDTGSIEAAEALARWRHPTQGSIPPGRFIPMVAALGLQGALFKRMVQLTLAAAAALRVAGTTMPLAINACATTLSNPENLDFLFNEARRAHVNLSDLKVELTEDAPVANMPILMAAMTRLQTWGCKVCLDDFGAGHANLGLLISLTFDELKLDREFAASIGKSLVARKSVQFALNLARDMGWRVVAEGIATDAQRDALHAMGCRHGQGFLWGRPMPLDALIDLLAQRQAVTCLHAAMLQDA